ncbi:MAG TPA: tRNA (adenosine(37)-N6)-dimethylallyltransferase MiaA [Acidimicrobiales bacterium]
MTTPWHGGRPPVALVGPTASGKSDMAIAAARAVAGTEIVVVDSMQVYRGMDIGTAKPSPADRAEVRHHGLDLVDPDVDFTVTEFQEAADAALATIAGRDGRALMVAGTGLYLRVVVDALDPPGQWPDVRAALDDTTDTVALHRRLAELDPVGASRMEPTNRRRVVRALEVTVGSGRPFSSFGPGLTAYPSSDVVQLGLRWPRPALVSRIEERFAAMLAAGLLDEVERLASAPRGLSRTAAPALGYKELLAHLRGECSLAEATDLAVTRTRQLAVRQLRWFQRDPRVRWFEMPDDGPAALALLVRALR